MKRLRIPLLSCISLLAASCLCGAGHSFEYVLSDTEAIILGYKGSTQHLVIPAEIEGKPVTRIQRKAFMGREELVSVQFPESLLYIRERAFQGCSNLLEVNLPDSVEIVSDLAFEGCLNLESITLPNKMVELQGTPFENCPSLHTIRLGEATVFPGDDWSGFSGCPSLVNIIIAEGNPNYRNLDGVILDPSLFYLLFYPPGLAGPYSIPESVHIIKPGAFVGCSKLTQLYIPKNVGYRNLDLNTNFTGCFALEAFVVDPENTSYQSQDGVLMKSDGTVLLRYPPGKPGPYIIPEGVTTMWSSLDTGAFADARNLTRVTFPESLTSIFNVFRFIPIADYGAPFRGCDLLEDIEVHADNPVFSSLDGVLLNKEQTTLIQYPTGRAGEYQIPENVTEVGYYRSRTGSGFTYCLKLTSLTIHSQLTLDPQLNGNERLYYIGCELLESVHVDAGHPELASIDGVLFDKSQSTLVDYPPGRMEESYTVPDGVTTILQAFSGSPNLISVELPDSLERIGEFAFAGCEKLTTINMGNAIVSIGYNAFRDCGNLTEVTLPPNLTYLGSSAFRDCSNLREITLPPNLTYLGSSAFQDCSSLREITLPENLESIQRFTLWNCENLEEVIISQGITLIDESAFGNCMRLTNVHLSEGLVEIVGFAFESCYSLKRLIFPASLERMGLNTLLDCIQLESVYFLGSPPQVWVDLGADAFGADVARVYYAENASGWGPSFLGIPTTPFDPDQTWGMDFVFLQEDRLLAETGSWLGWLDVSLSPWIHHPDSNSWLYMWETVSEQREGWIYLPGLEINNTNIPPYELIPTEGGEYFWSNGLGRWIYPDASGWAYLL